MDGFPTCADRRRFLATGLSGALGVSFASPFSQTSLAAGTAVRRTTVHADAMIVVFLPGGVPQQDTFDPKPESPAQYRGELGVVQTREPGVHFGSPLPRLATVTDKFCVLRAMSHLEADHDRGKMYVYSGNRPNPAVQYPSIGSVLTETLGPRSAMPPYVFFPLEPETYIGSGFLNPATGPFHLGRDYDSDPSSAGFHVRDLRLPDHVTDARFERRRRFLSTIDRDVHDRTRTEEFMALDAFRERAYGMVASEDVRAAFDLEHESDAVRDDYGRNSAGQGLLLARRLVEAGARCVTMNYPGVSPGSAGAWDLHLDVHELLVDLAPQFDRALASLLDDLESRGRLERTLVVVTTEFGRGPKINATAGRDHWARVFSSLLAGGGIKGGVVHGRSDSVAAEPADDPVSVEDLCRTIYDRLGIDSRSTLLAPGDRPIPLVNGGRLINEILV